MAYQIHENVVNALQFLEESGPQCGIGSNGAAQWIAEIFISSSIRYTVWNAVGSFYKRWVFANSVTYVCVDCNIYTAHNEVMIHYLTYINR